MEKVVLFFLAKQGELASGLLDARREKSLTANRRDIHMLWCIREGDGRMGQRFTHLTLRKQPSQEPRLLIYRGGNRLINVLPPAKR